METIDHNLIEIALERVNGEDFERFFQAFYPALTDVDFVPLGGTHDGGADAFWGEAVFESKADGQNKVFYQATTQENHRAKIRNTVQRLIEYGRNPIMVQYITSRVIRAIDKEEERLLSEFKLPIKIRDRKWIVNNLNYSPQTVAAFNTFLKPCLTFLERFGEATTVGNSSNINARTLCVFLGQEIDQRRGHSDLLEAVTDSLILWSLEETNPKNNKLMTRSEIRNKIEQELPSTKKFIHGIFDHRIEAMAAKNNPTGREIRWYRKEDKFCLPYETRKIVTQENHEDEILKRKVMDIYEERATSNLDENDEIFPGQMACLVHRTLELTFERKGLELVNVLVGDHEEGQDFAISDQVDRAINEAKFTGSNAIKAKEISLSILRHAFYNSSETEREYYGKLSRTYTLMLTLRHEPKIVEYFKGMSSNFVLFVGSDIIVRALSERYLSNEDKMTVNMLRILREAGSTLIISHLSVEEVHSHIRNTDREYRNYFQQLEPHIDKEIARHASKILLRAYFYARLEPLSEKPPAGWRMFIEQICNYNDLNQDSTSRDQVKNYLIEKFDFEYMNEDDMKNIVNNEEAKQLADQIKPIKSDDILAHNDARHILAIYGKRSALREDHKPNPYGYRSWWLTHETKVRRVTRDLVKSHGSEYIIRPEFILNFIALSPTTESVRKSYGNIFPTLLGIKLSNRMREKVFRDVMERAKNIAAVDEARVHAKMIEMSNRLKGDNYKAYENELSDGPLDIQNAEDDM